MTLIQCQAAIAKKLKKLRAHSGLKQTDVAAETGISHRYYQDIEGGRVNMTLKTLHRLAKLHKVRLSDIVVDC
jgi:transcriptional regulator with XRE-family HTH domain